LTLKNGTDRLFLYGSLGLGRPRVGTTVEDAIRARLATGEGVLKVAKRLGIGTSTVQRDKAGSRFEALLTEGSAPVRAHRPSRCCSRPSKRCPPTRNTSSCRSLAASHWATSRA